ncbi:MAG: isoamylase early set domain-containing protein [Desulfatibacillaceae bacterium]
MAIIKKYLKTKPVCKTTFELPKDAVSGDPAVFLVGDFNAWSKTATPMKRLKNGQYKATVDLEAGRSYRFRYLIGEDQWENDWEADRYEPSPYTGADNSVVQV